MTKAETIKGKNGLMYLKDARCPSCLTSEITNVKDESGDTWWQCQNCKSYVLSKETIDLDGSPIAHQRGSNCQPKNITGVI